MLEDKKSFCSWLNNHSNNHEYGFAPHPNWFDKVQESHKKLREFIKSNELVRTIETSQSQQALPQESCYDIHKAFALIIHDLEQKHRKILWYPYASMLVSHLYYDDGGRVVKTAKYIRKKMASKLKTINITPKTDPKTFKIIDNALSDLGQRWSTQKSIAFNFDIKLTTLAQDFVLLGHYGPDNDSCFRNGHENDHHKFVIGQTPNTFVLLFRHEGRRVLRAWGFFNDDFDTVNICNKYEDLPSGINQGTILNACRKFFAEVFDNKNIYCFHNNISVECSAPYHNEGSPDWSFSTNREIAKQRLFPVIADVIDHVRCNMCNIMIEEGCQYIVDDITICEECSQGSHLCESCDGYTFNITPLLNVGGDSIFMCDECRLVREIVHCDNCGEDTYQRTLSTHCPACEHEYQIIQKNTINF